MVARKKMIVRIVQDRDVMQGGRGQEWNQQQQLDLQVIEGYLDNELELKKLKEEFVIKLLK